MHIPHPFVLRRLRKVLFAASKCVCSLVLLARNWQDDEVVVLEFLSPADLATGELFSLDKVLEGLVIGEYLDRCVGAEALGSPFLKGSNNSEEFFIIDGVVALSRVKLLREVSYGIELPVFILLHYNASTNIVRRIHLNIDCFSRIEVSQHRVRTDGFF